MTKIFNRLHKPELSLIEAQLEVQIKRLSEKDLSLTDKLVLLDQIDKLRNRYDQISVMLQED